MLASVTPFTRDEREARRRSAYSVFANREPFNSGRSVRADPLPDDGSAAFFSDDYRPEMADCKGW